jgi:hypothetical protein
MVWFLHHYLFCYMIKNIEIILRKEWF